MPFEYKSIVPWGRSFREYQKMFALSEHDLKRKILGCGDGPASFNCELTGMGGNVTSYDPIYLFSKAEIKQRIDETYQLVMKQTRNNKDKFNWKSIPDVETLGVIRMNAMQLFLEDFETGKKQNRYVYGELPDTSKLEGGYDLALFSHFLFLYTDNLSYAFHEEVLLEVMRIADEIRIFPVLDYNGNESEYLGRIKKAFIAKNYECFLRKVNYEFQKNGNKMLVIKKSKAG